MELVGGDHTPRYFFHIRDELDLIPDDEGIDFPNLEMAEAEGYARARDLATGALLSPYCFAADTVEIKDELGVLWRRIKIEGLIGIYANSLAYPQGSYEQQ